MMLIIGGKYSHELVTHVLVLLMVMIAIRIENVTSLTPFSSSFHYNRPISTTSTSTSSSSTNKVAAFVTSSNKNRNRNRSKIQSKWNTNARCMNNVAMYSHATTATTDDKVNDGNNNNNVNDEDNQQLLKAIGVPETIKYLKIGQELKAFRRAMVLDDDVDDDDDDDQEPVIAQSNFTIQRASTTPDVFILRNFLSNYECDSIISYASGDGDGNENTMSNAETITNNDTQSRKRCQVAWLPSSSTSSTSTTLNGKTLTQKQQEKQQQISYMVSNLVSSTANILLSKHVLSHPSASVEDLQVLKYDIGGEFVLHHDGEPRILTVIYYVNGVGGTWFPLANTSEDNTNDPCKDMDETKIQEGFMNTRNKAAGGGTSTDNNSNPQTNADALELGKGFIPGKQGLLVKGGTTSSDHNNDDNDSDDDNVNVNVNDDQNSNISRIQKGDAIAFYNYQTDGSGDFDWRALHTGLPTTEEDGVKWIANHWFRLGHLL